MFALTGREGPSNVCEPGGRGGGGLMSVRTFPYKRLIETFKKKKECTNGQELWLKVEKDQQQYEKTIIKLKGEL